MLIPNVLDILEVVGDEGFDYSGAIAYRSDAGAVITFWSDPVCDGYHNWHAVYTCVIPECVKETFRPFDISYIAQYAYSSEIEIKNLYKSTNIIDKIMLLDILQSCYGKAIIDKNPVIMTKEQLSHRFNI